MNEENIYEILNSYKEAIDVLLNRCDELVNQNRALEERVNKVESILFDEILEPARLALEADDKERRFGEFNDKYGEKLGAFDKILGAAEGNPDFSMARSAFDEYEKIETDVYVDGLIETVEEQIDSIKESLGIEPDAKVEITQDENGDTEIKADGEVVASETEETKEEGETTEEGTEPTEEGEQGELDFGEDEEEEDDPEEIKKLEEELAKSL